MLISLSLILIILVLLICGNKGPRAIITTAGNSILLLLSVLLIYKGASPLAVTMIMSTLSSCLVLFFQNGVNLQTKLSFLSAMLVILIMIPLVYYLISGANSQGFVPEEYEITDSNGYTRNIAMNMMHIQISVMIIALIGAVIDTSVAVSSSICEIYRTNPRISKSKLAISGMNVGKSVLSTSMHTIFYIYIAEYMTLIMQYVQDYSFMYMINSKSFSQGFLSITICGIGCCIIVPVTVIITVSRLTSKKAI